MPTQGKLGAKAVILVGVGEPRSSTPTRSARRAPRWPAARPKVATVATTLLEAAPDSLDDADAAQALAEGVHLGSYQFLKYKGDAQRRRS